MDKNFKIKMTLFIVIFILLIALVIYAVAGTKTEREYYHSSGNLLHTIAPVLTDPPESLQPVPESQVPVMPSPTAIPAATPEPTPEPTPSPTPEPTPTPQPAGMEAGSGSVRSNSGALIDIRADWRAYVTDDTHVAVEVSTYVEHYTLYCIEADSLRITVNGNAQTVHADAINCDENGKTETLLGTAVFSLDLQPGQSVSVPLQARWSFGGDYRSASNPEERVDLPFIDAEGQILLAR